MKRLPAVLLLNHQPVKCDDVVAFVLKKDKT
nr:MAG TPA: hypothetical protein [Caudoviricetes sp.]